jgi:hypothetical protein
MNFPHVDSWIPVSQTVTFSPFSFITTTHVRFCSKCIIFLVLFAPDLFLPLVGFLLSFKIIIQLI